MRPPKNTKKKEVKSVGAPTKSYEEKGRTGQYLVRKEIVDKAMDIAKSSNPLPAIMEAAALIAATNGGRGDPTGFVIHQMSAHPELAPRLKDFIVDPPPGMYFSSYVCPQFCFPSVFVSLLLKKNQL